jgi:hypothetical protein
MDKEKLVQVPRPKAGCARCVWWPFNGHNGWRKCMLLGVKMWYEHAPCSEYEEDTNVLDVIRIKQCDILQS